MYRFLNGWKSRFGIVLGSNEIKKRLLPVIHVGFTVQEGTTFKWNHFLDIIFQHVVCWATTHLKHEQILMFLSYTFQISQVFRRLKGWTLAFLAALHSFVLFRARWRQMYWMAWNLMCRVWVWCHMMPSSKRVVPSATWTIPSCWTWNL